MSGDRGARRCDGSSTDSLTSRRQLVRGRLTLLRHEPNRKLHGQIDTIRDL